MRKGSELRGGENNRLLASLPRKEYRQLSEHFELNALEAKQVLHRPENLIDYVYFPQQGVISLQTVMRDGTRVEVATVGNEGMVGIGAVFHGLHERLFAVCQVPGTTVRMRASVFERELKRSDVLEALIGRYTQALMIQFTQSVACNRLHSVEQRCARWLLMTRDRVASDTFPLTQEFLGQMLGVRRASVTVIAGLLQKAGLIQYARGVIRVVDRAGLEKQSCECYEVIKEEQLKPLTLPNPLRRKPRSRPRHRSR